MTSIFEATVIAHQVFSKLNHGIEIFYLENGWAIKSPFSKAVFTVEKNQLKVSIDHVDFFIDDTVNTVITEIKAFVTEDSNIFYFQELYASLGCKNTN